MAKDIIRTFSLRERVSEFLLDELCKGNLQPGERLNIASLAKELGVSTTPMREALFGLSEKGMIEFVNNKGFNLKTLNFQDAKEIYHISSILDAQALACSGPIDQKMITKLSKLLVKLENEIKKNRVTFQTLSAFENLIVSGCNNKRLLNIISELRYSAFQYEQVILKSGLPMDDAFCKHRQIIELMSEQKLPQAAKCLGETWMECLPLLEQLLCRDAE